MWRGDIRFTGTVNGREVRLLLDNGFIWDELLFFGGPRVEALGLKADGEIEVGGGGDGDPVPSKTASGITLGFPGVVFHDQSAVLTPTESGVWRMWWGSEGQVCGTFFKHFVVGIDFDRDVITLTRPEDFSPAGKGDPVELEPFGDGAWGIPARMKLQGGRTLHLVLAMDLGDGKALELDQRGPHKLTAPKRSVEGSLGFGIQGDVTGCHGRVESVTIGRHRVGGVVAGFVSPDHQGPVFHEAVAGMELLSRFNLVFDYPGRRLFITPNRSFAKPFEHEMTGAGLFRGEGDWLEVVRLNPGSPAAEAGLKLGDRVTRIDGRPATGYDAWDLRPMMRRRGATVTFTVEREGKAVDVPVKLRPLI